MIRNRCRYLNEQAISVVAIIQQWDRQGMGYSRATLKLGALYLYFFLLLYMCVFLDIFRTPGNNYFITFLSMVIPLDPAVTVVLYSCQKSRSEQCWSHFKQTFFENVLLTTSALATNPWRIHFAALVAKVCQCKCGEVTNLFGICLLERPFLT